MKIANFSADSDLVGRRTQVTWDFVLEALETVADIPPVHVRRKLRDFAFPPSPAGSPDPFLLYDSATFPPSPNPPDVTVRDLPEWVQSDGVTRTVVSVTSVARLVNNWPVEVLRRTTSTTSDTSGRPLQQRIDILDTGNPPDWLRPGITYYYQIFSTSIPFDDDVTLYRAAASATESYGLNRTLYESLPAIYRRHDVVTRPPLPRVNDMPESIPEAAPKSGQLRRFLDPLGIALDFMRGKAEGLRNLRDIDNVNALYLPLLAQWIGWDLSFDVAIPLQRNELKNAVRVYSGVGTLPTLRALVTHYTGWSTQIAEFAQQLVRSNLPLQLNIYWKVEGANGWRGGNDAAVMLGFDVGNDDAVGSAGKAATLISSTVQPFALRPEMEFSVTAEDSPVQVVRFGPKDFNDITIATAAEIAAVMNRTLSGLAAMATVDGRLQLTSDTVGLSSQLHVNAFASSLLTLENAPQGRVNPFVDTLGRVRLFYETVDLPTPSARVIHYKTFAFGSWSNAVPLPGLPGVAQGSPAAVEFAPGQIQIAWIDQPYTEQSSIRTMQGTARPMQPARLIGQLAAPFTMNIAAGARLALRGHWATPDLVVFAASDFVNAKQATAAEVVKAINARATHVVASVLPNNRLQLATVDTGPNARLEIDLRGSIATQALGFDVYNASAQGSWSDGIDWGAVQNVDSAPAGLHSDLHALRDGSGTFWLFWAMYLNSTWCIVTTRFLGGAWTPLQVLADGSGGNREPFALLDAAQHISLFWSRRQGIGTREDYWTIQRRVYDPTAQTWTAEASITTPPAPNTDLTQEPPPGTDREPAAVLLPTGNIRLYYRSNRSGGTEVWSIAFDATGVAGMPTLTTGGRPAADSAPAPLVLPDGTLSLFYRSDASISLAQVAMGGTLATNQTPATGQDKNSWASVRVPDAAALRHFAGMTSPVRAELLRNGQRSLWADMVTYTPQRPLGDPLLQDELYTRNTLGFYINQGSSDHPLTGQYVARLRQLLQRFMPINMRAVLVLIPSLDREDVYPAGTGIGEIYQDQYPFVEYYRGLNDSTAAALPDRVLLLSNTKADVSANPADLQSLHFRTYGPPPQ